MEQSLNQKKRREIDFQIYGSKVIVLSRLNDLTGQIFGKLTVIKRVEDYIFPKGQRKTQWLCECNCDAHNRIMVLGSNLTKNNTSSCGCLQKERASEFNKEYNIYDLSGEYGIGYTLKGEEFYFDLEDYDLISKYCWHITNRGYVTTRDENRRGRRINFHRLVMGLTSEKIDVDHIHGKKTRNDNRKENLRLATRSQNNMNSALSKNNTTGVTGVYFDKNAKKWSASIMVNYKTIYLGLFDKFEDAVKARKEAEDKYFGEYSYDNSMNGAI